MALGVLVPSDADAALSPDAYAGRVLTLVNDYRADHGLRPLSLAPGTTRVAASWTQHMASAGALSHNPNLRRQLEANGSSGWHILGENVGKGDVGYPDRLFQAYIDSPAHRDNILTAGYRYVGNAVVFSGGLAWHTMDFVDVYGSATATAPKAAPKPAPRPAPVAAPKPVVRTKPVAAPARVTRPAVVARPVAPRPAPRPAATVAHDVSALGQFTVFGTAPAPSAPVVLGTQAHNSTPSSLPQTLAVALLVMLALAWTGAAATGRLRVQRSS